MNKFTFPRTNSITAIFTNRINITNADAWRSSLGLYQAAVKLAVIMKLFIQMFRYAAEPFFFRRAREKDSRQLYASVQEYFTAFCGLVFLGVILYIDVIALILGPQFRSAVAYY